MNDNEAESLYESEEISITKFSIILCELYNKKLHGETDSYVDRHYIVFTRFKKLDLHIISDYINHLSNLYKKLIRKNANAIKNHTIFKNYKNIISRNNYIKIEIAECIYLNDFEYIAIIKTYWIKLIQRTWKKIFKIRQEVIKKRMLIKSIKYRELNGFWPQNCKYIPSLKGILSYLKN